MQEQPKPTMQINANISQGTRTNNKEINAIMAINIQLCK